MNMLILLMIYLKVKVSDRPPALMKEAYTVAANKVRISASKATINKVWP